jgi:Ion channel
MGQVMSSLDRIGDTMETPIHTVEHSSVPRLAYRLTDTYGLVLILIVTDYIAASALTTSGWGRFATTFLLSATILLILRVSRSRRIWQMLAVIYLLVSTVSSLVSEVTPGTGIITHHITILAGILLLATPIAILRHIASHPVVTTETVLGAVCVYLLIGFSFGFIYSGIALLSPSPFFQGHALATINNTLFFSYTTLTTVGYGDLVPAKSLGQTFAMLEALFGQIYLVLIVARLVSLWGQERLQTPGAGGQQLHDATPTSRSEVSDDSV